MTALQGAVRDAIERRGDGHDQNVEIAAAGWHSEPVIRQLCAAFNDPIETISISEESLVEITLKIPAKSQSAAKIVVDPHGTARVLIRDVDGEHRIWAEETRWLGERVSDRLEKAGLPGCIDAKRLSSGWEREEK